MTLSSIGPYRISIEKLAPTDPLDVLVCPPGSRKKTVGPGKIEVLPCRVKEAAEFSVYTYDVYLDSSKAADPEIEIDK